MTDFEFLVLVKVCAFGEVYADQDSAEEAVRNRIEGLYIDDEDLIQVSKICYLEAL